MNEVTDAVVDKIRKCLNLAHGKNATPGEMAAAMGKAKEIAMRYNIEIASINLSEGKSAAASMTTDKVGLHLRSKNEQLYHNPIYRVLRAVFGVRTIRIGKGRGGIILVGESHDVAICKELFPWLEDVFYATYYKAKRAGQVISCAAHKNGIYVGLEHGIIEANKKEEAKLNKEEASCMALMVVDKTAMVDQRVEEEFPDLKEARNTTSQVAGFATQIGYNKGKSIKLNQLGGQTNHGQLN